MSTCNICFHGEMEKKIYLFMENKKNIYFSAGKKHLELWTSKRYDRMADNAKTEHFT